MNSMPPMHLHPMNGLPQLRIHEQKVVRVGSGDNLFGSEIPAPRRVNETAQRELRRNIPPSHRVNMALPGHSVKRRSETENYSEQRETKRARVAQDEPSTRPRESNALMPRQTFDGFRTRDERNRAFITLMTYDNDYPVWFTSFQLFIQTYPILEQKAIAENMVLMMHKFKDTSACHNGIKIYLSVHAIFMTIDNIDYRRDKYKKEIVKQPSILKSIERITSQENGDWAIFIFPHQDHSRIDPIIKIKKDSPVHEVLQKIRLVPRDLDMVVSFWRKA